MKALLVTISILLVCILSPIAMATGPQSIAVGSHGGGSVDGAVRVPVGDPWLRMLRKSRSRRYDYGHSRVVGALMDVAQRYGTRTWPNRPLWLGNIGVRGGGKIRPSRSHQIGLDVDIVIPVLDPRRHPPAIRSVYPPSEEADPKIRTMDVNATWILVEEILRTPELDILWLFIARPLANVLIEHAIRERADPDIVLRAILLLHQPSDSRSHDDHLHLRVGCSMDDRLAGCVNSGPRWSWVLETHRRVERFAFLELIRALFEPSRLSRALDQVVRSSSIPLTPWLKVGMLARDPNIRDAYAKALSALSPDQFLEWVSQMDPVENEFFSLERKALQKAPGLLAAERALYYLETDGEECPNGDVEKTMDLLDILIRDPIDGAADAVATCARSSDRRVRKKAFTALARIAGTSVPKRLREKEIARMAALIEEYPEDRLQRLTLTYLPANRSFTPWQAVARLRKRVFGSGIDAMNIRDLLEAKVGWRRRTNLVSPSRRRRIWLNRTRSVRSRKR
ncbi:MAG: hypothetical protein CMH54_03370 [Myxococcales bacterium]|nr:hypothetical protein [Myxococcales bacterium]